MNFAPDVVSNTVSVFEDYGGKEFLVEKREKDLRRERPEALIEYIEELESELKTMREKSKYIAQELDLFRQRRAIFWSDRFRNTFDAWSLVSKGFQRLKDDTAIFNGNLSGYRLQPSLSMARVAHLSYKVSLKTANLSGVLLAPVVEMPVHKGEICLQILGSSQELLVEAYAPISDVNDDDATIFRFPALAASKDEELTLKVFIQSVDVPVRLLEMRRYALNGFGGLSTICFAGFIFDEE